jgi:hypothetical protein
MGRSAIALKRDSRAAHSYRASAPKVFVPAFASGACLRQRPRTHQSRGPHLDGAPPNRGHSIQTGKPTQNAFIEAFNGRLRDECLNEHWFTSLAEARRSLEAWRRHYNETRTLLSLGKDAPEDRSLERPGQITALPMFGRPHQRYCRT